MNAVYRSMDQEELDRQYNVRASIPETGQIFDRWQRDSDAFRTQHSRLAEIDLAYDHDPLQTLDYFRSGKPDGALVVFIHGGYWQSLDKSFFSYVAQPYVADGLNVAVINYRLTPAVEMGVVVSDCRKALLWLWHNAGALGFDRERLVVSGSSAGGHLTSVLASTNWGTFELPHNPITGACALSGLYDLEPIRLCYLNQKIGLDAETAKRNSPVHMVPRSGPPLILSTGGNESAEFHRQEREYARLWRAASLECDTIEQSDGHHFDMVDRLGTRGSSLYQAVLTLTG
jgi:arylformamidase